MQHMLVCACLRVCVCVCVLVVFTDRRQSTAMSPNVLTCLVQHMLLARQLTQPSAHLPLKGLSPQQQSQVLSQYNHDQQRAPAPMQPMVHRLPTCLVNSFLCLCTCCCCWNGWLAVPTVCCLRMHVGWRLYACSCMLECIYLLFVACTCMWQCACMPACLVCCLCQSLPGCPLLGVSLLTN